jgi:hypothetical protein
MPRVNRSHFPNVRAVVTLFLALVATAACQSGPRNPTGPDAVTGNQVVPPAFQSGPITQTSALRPDRVCRGGPGGSPCWTPGSSPPTGPQSGSELMTFEFAGTISYLPPPLDTGPFAVGQAANGSYTFDPTVSDEDPSTVVGMYRGLVAFNISVPGASYVASAAPGAQPGFIEILNNEDGVRDRYVASMTAPDQALSGTTVPFGTLARLAIVLRDRTTLAFSSDALPLTPPLLSDFASGQEAFIGFEGSWGSGELAITLSSLSAP